MEQRNLQHFIQRLLFINRFILLSDELISLENSEKVISFSSIPFRVHL